MIEAATQMPARPARISDAVPEFGTSLADEIGGPQLLVASDLAKIYGVTPKTIRNYARRGGAEGPLAKRLPVAALPQLLLWNSTDLPGRREFRLLRAPRGARSHRKRRTQLDCRAEPAATATG